MAQKNTTPADLGIDPSASPQQLYRWFLASLLFGRNIRQTQAASTYGRLMEHGFTSPAAFDGTGREQLRRILDEGGYDRFDYHMADELHGVMAGVQHDWRSVHHLVASAKDRDEAHDRLVAYKGVGDVTARIFLDEVPAGTYGTAD